jgi:hypothetical protein
MERTKATWIAGGHLTKAGLSALLVVVPVLVGARDADGGSGQPTRPAPNEVVARAMKGSSPTTSFPADIYTEPKAVSPETLENLGPLRRMAGVWEGKGVDEHPAAEGTAKDVFVERIELQPIDPQTNGPQLLYGLRYHTRIVKPGEVATFHDQVGYWLWEPATQTVIHTLAIPRAQVAMAAGRAAPDANRFELVAQLGAESFGICSSPFLQYAFRTVEFRIRISFDPSGTWSYEEDTVMAVRGREGLFHHTDRNTLTKVAEPMPNPLSAARTR